MARLLVDDEWFDAVAPGSYFEKDFETYLLQNADVLFPGFFMCPFTRSVQGDEGVSRPDLALIDLEYREWWVVEVELGTHPLYGHVYEQVQNFARGVYDFSHADALAVADSRLDVERCREMVLKGQPRVLVLVNESKPTWAQALSRFDALVGVVEVFRNSEDRVILRVNGQQPEGLDVSIVSDCRQGMLPNMLKLESPGAVSNVERVVTALSSGGTAAWKVMRTKGDAWLVPEGRWPLPQGISHAQLRKSERGDMHLVFEFDGRTHG